MAINKKLFEKYLEGSASKQEVSQVLLWLKSEEGQNFLSEKYDKDLENLNALEQSFNELSEPDRNFSTIKKKINKKKPLKLVSRPNGFYRVVTLVAACILLIVTTISIIEIFYKTNIVTVDGQISMNEYSTLNEQKLLTLSDGTRIRLNANTTIEIPSNFESDSRHIRLDGEAFFEVTHDPGRPFIVTADNARIRVLGTKFNIKNNATYKGNVYVAVTEGRVALAVTDDEDNEEILERGMIGKLNFGTNKITTSYLEVDNYLTWIHGRIVFHRTPFQDVVRQLEHIYDMNSKVNDDELLQMDLTANFSATSFEDVVRVIAEGLDIKYEIVNDTVIWSTR